MKGAASASTAARYSATSCLGPRAHGRASGAGGHEAELEPRHPRPATASAPGRTPSSSLRSSVRPPREKHCCVGLFKSAEQEVHLDRPPFCPPLRPTWHNTSERGPGASSRVRSEKSPTTPRSDRASKEGTTLRRLRELRFGPRFQHHRGASRRKFRPRPFASPRQSRLLMGTRRGGVCTRRAAKRPWERRDLYRGGGRTAGGQRRCPTPAPHTRRPLADVAGQPWRSSKVSSEPSLTDPARKSSGRSVEALEPVAPRSL